MAGEFPSDEIFSFSPTTTSATQSSGDIETQGLFSAFICLAVTVVAILLLIFFWILLCVRRQHQLDDMASAAPREEIRHPYPVGLIPTITYPETPSSLPESCPVCLEDFVAGEKLKSLPRCKHLFHDECISQWLNVSIFPACPVCREAVIDIPAHRARMASWNPDV